MAQRLGLEPSPRVLGVDVNTLEFAFDRGTLSTVEASYQQDTKSARSGWKAIHSLPKDHLDWQRRQTQLQETSRTEERLWSLEERYNDKMLQLASQEAARLRQDRRSGKESVSTEDDPRHCHPMLALTQDYWLSASKVAADYHAKGVDDARSACGLWKVPPGRPLTQGRSVANCGGEAFRGDSGLQARARRHLDTELREVNTAAPAHPCGPHPCFPLHSEPARLQGLP